MAVMLVDRSLRSDRGGDVIGIATQGMKVEILDDRALPWTKVKLVELPDPLVGWVSDDAINKKSDVLGPLDKSIVARECVEAAAKFGNNAYYAMSVALLRTNVEDGPPGQTRGIFAFSPAEWHANGDKSQYGVKYAAPDIKDWRAQVTLFSIMALEMQLKMADLLERQPSMIELLLTQTVGSKAAAALIAEPTKPVADILAAVSDADLTADGIDRTMFAARDAKLLAGPEGSKVLADIGAAMDKSFRDSKPLVRPRADAFLAVAAQFGGINPAQPTTVNLKAANVPAERSPMAELIVNQFAAAGYGRVQQVAAVANAIAESGLDPGVKSRGTERSFGLFQLNQNKGVGTGYSEDELRNPAKNVEIMLAEIAKPYQKAARTMFATTNDIDEAVHIFVYEFERPADKKRQAEKRAETARRLMRLA